MVDLTYKSGTLWSDTVLSEDFTLYEKGLYAQVTHYYQGGVFGHQATRLLTVKERVKRRV
ncbi:MAG: hypothetical protein OXE59_10745 [Bacteroidetes bacterium]|nr:hypothetical protein [Bacteroidota bacterium]MCY4234200.1 hypothetical protein [Bacteroidota bacterium]